MYLDRTLAQRIAERKAKSKVKVTHCVRWHNASKRRTSQTM